MLESVKSRPEKVKLMIKISHGDKVDVPEETMNANREWLYTDTITIRSPVIYLHP